MIIVRKHVQKLWHLFIKETNKQSTSGTKLEFFYFFVMETNFFINNKTQSTRELYNVRNKEAR